MTTEIKTCSYSPNATDALKDLSSDQIKQASVNELIGKIVTKYLKYEGTEEYTINLKNGLITFTIEGLDTEARTLKLENNKWKLTQGATTTEADEDFQTHIGTDITTVLNRVRTAAATVLPATSSSPSAPALHTGTAPSSTPQNGGNGVTINLNVNGQQVSTTPAVDLTPQIQALHTGIKAGEDEASELLIPPTPHEPVVALDLTPPSKAAQVGSALYQGGSMVAQGGLGLARFTERSAASLGKGLYHMFQWALSKKQPTTSNVIDV